MSSNIKQKVIRRKVGALYRLEPDSYSANWRLQSYPASIIGNKEFKTIEIPFYSPVMYLGHSKKLDVAKILYDEKICFLHGIWLSDFKISG